jgi:hypothetical protein
LIAPRAAIGAFVACVTQCRALPRQGSTEDLSDGTKQATWFPSAQRISGAQRVKLGWEEHLVSVDVAQSSQESLIEQQRLQSSSTAREMLLELLRAILITQRLGTQVADYLVSIVHQVNPSQLANVVESQLISVIHHESSVDVPPA